MNRMNTESNSGGSRTTGKAGRSRKRFKTTVSARKGGSRIHAREPENTKIVKHPRKSKRRA